jgi:dolichol-phosphate mannosyltransferase
VKKISIIVPIYNESDTLKFFYTELVNVINLEHYDFEIIFSVDPGTDNTQEILKELITIDSRVKVIEMTRKFGQATAIFCGLENCSGDAVIVMDADLQDPPSVIPMLIKKWEMDNLIVLAMRKSRIGDNLIKRSVTNIGYRFLSTFTDVPIPKNVGDFRLLDRKIVELVKLFPESRLYLRGIISLIGYPYEIVYFDRPARLYGETKYNKFFGSVPIALDGIIGFSTSLLNLSTYLGIITGGIAILIASSYVTLKFFGFPFPIGNPTIVFLVLFMGAVNLLSIGIIGMYIGRIAEDVKRRPRYLIKDRYNF